MATSPFDDYKPGLGDNAPDFTLNAVFPDGDVQPVSLGELTSAAGEHSKGVIVYFYPAAMTPGCTTEACDFRDNLASLMAAGYAVLGVSPDTPEKLERFREKYGLSFPLASDPDHTVATAFNVYGPHNVMGHIKTSIIRSTFAIDNNGKISYVKRNARAKGHVQRLRADLGIG